jgi:hypothetical protein
VIEPRAADRDAQFIAVGEVVGRLPSGRMLLGEEQEVAYNSVLIERRKLLHERTAEGLQTLFADSIEEHLADAYH